MNFSFDAKDFDFHSARMLAIAGATFSLAQHSFGQNTSIDPYILSSAQAHASPNNIPVVFEGFGESTLDQGLKDIRIRGKMARALFKKNVFLVALERDLDGSRFSYSGRGAVYFKSRSGVVESTPINIFPFQFDRVLVPYSEYVNNPGGGDRKVVWDRYTSDTGEYNSAYLVKAELLSAINTAMQLSNLSADPDDANLQEYYYPRFKELIQNGDLGTFTSLQNFPSIMKFQEEKLNSEFKRYEELLNVDVPHFLKSTHSKLKQEYKNCEWMRSLPINGYASAAWQNLNPDLSSVPEQGQASEKVLFDAIKSGIDIDMRTIRRLGLQLENSLEIVAEQNEKYKELTKPLEALKENPACNVSIKKQITDSINALKRSSDDTPTVFRKAVEAYNSTVVQIKIDFDRLDKVYKAEQAKIAEQKLIESKILQEQLAREKAWQDFWGTVVTGLVIAGGLIIAFFGMLSGGGGGSSTLLTRPDPEPDTGTSTFLDSYEPAWKRDGRPDGQSSPPAD